ncbi:hypothetical protein P7C70_g7484, partial [Phenoliferia sp. Uapishka_3]
MGSDSRLNLSEPPLDSDVSRRQDTQTGAPFCFASLLNLLTPNVDMAAENKSNKPSAQKGDKLKLNGQDIAGAPKQEDNAELKGKTGGAQAGGSAGSAATNMSDSSGHAGQPRPQKQGDGTPEQTKTPAKQLVNSESSDHGAGLKQADLKKSKL